MEQYIPKSAVVAEIDSMLKFVEHTSHCDEASFNSGRWKALTSIKNFIDTLEVKEVDLEKELIEWHKKHFKKEGTFIRMSGFYLTNNSQMDIAKHFFELGLKAAQKGE